MSASHPQSAARTSDAASRVFSRATLLQALMVAVAVVVVAATLAGLLVFGGDAFAPASALPYFVAGVLGAVVAMTGTVWLHGRFAATPVPGGDPGRAAYVATSRLQSLLAAAFGVKLAVVVLGVLALKQFPLTSEPTKFIDIATFAVTFAGASLLCQLGTALVLARTLRRRSAAGTDLPPPDAAADGRARDAERLRGEPRSL